MEVTDTFVFLTVAQLNELLVKSLHSEFSKILSAHDFSSSLPTELKDLPSKFNDLTEEVKGLKKHVHELKIELPGHLNEIPTKLDNFTTTVSNLTTQVAELETLQWELPAEFLSLPTQAIASASKKTEDASVPSAGQAGTQPAEGGKNTNQATISQLFQRKAGEHIKKDKGKKAMSSKDDKEEGSDSESDDTINLTCFRGIEKSVKAEATKHEVEVRKEKLVDLLGPDVVSKEVVKACPNRKGKGWSTIYEQIRTRMDYLYETKAELGIDLDKPLSEQDQLDKLNDLTNKKRKHADDIHDYFRANKRLKSSVQYEDHPAGTMLNEPVLGIIILHQGPGLDDHARTFNSFLLAEIDKRNLNPLKQMSLIEQLWGRLLGSVHEPFSLSVDLNIKSPKYSQAEDSSA
ncbi:hypothetical protein Tco_1375536 [Tanacetum coccineum]